MFKIGPEIMKQIREAKTSSIPEASADDPIYTRGFAIGEMRSRSSSKATAAKPKQPPVLHGPPDELELEAHNLYEKGLTEYLDKQGLIQASTTANKKEPT